MGASDRLAGRKIAIFGGSSGLGYGVAQALLEAGAHVIIISSTEARVQDAVKRLDSPNVSGKASDIRDEAAITQLLKGLAPLEHVIVSSVDKILLGPLVDTDLDLAKNLFGVKFWGSIIVAKVLLKHDIVKPGGSLTLTSGALSRGANPILAALNGGLSSMTQLLADELTPKKVRVNTVVPGLVQTELWDKLVSKDTLAGMYEEAASKLSVGFVATAEQLAEAYVYAVRADYANGTTISIDGLVKP